MDIFIWFSELRDTIEEWVDRFFQNPGERIKSISRWNLLVMTLAGLVGGIIWGILLEEAWLAILLGFCGLLVGIIFGWASSICKTARNSAGCLAIDPSQTARACSSSTPPHSRCPPVHPCGRCRGGHRLQSKDPRW